LFLLLFNSAWVFGLGVPTRARDLLLWVPPPRRDESAKPETAKQDAATNAQMNGQHQKSSSAKN
jgi:hypothetical protein